MAHVGSFCHFVFVFVIVFVFVFFFVFATVKCNAIFIFVYIYLLQHLVRKLIYTGRLLESSVFVFVFACVFVIVITGASLDSTRRELSESVFYVGL